MSPAPGKEGVPTCWRSFHPTPLPTRWGGLTERGPQRIFVLQSCPPTSLSWCWKSARVLGTQGPHLIHPIPPQIPLHLPGPMPAEQSEGSLGAGSCPEGGPLCLVFPPSESCVPRKKTCSAKVSRRKKINFHPALNLMPCNLQTSSGRRVLPPHFKNGETKARPAAE